MTLKAIDYRDENASSDFVTSLKETGFAVLKNHPIPQVIVDRIYHHWQDFFNSDAKQDYLFDPQTMDGYYPINISETAKGYSTKDIKEYFHYYHPWGKCPEDLRDELISYRNHANSLATELLSWVEQHTPAEVSQHYSEPLSSMIKDSEQTLLRVLHYPPLSGEESPQAIRAAAHEDINLLTLLPAASDSGLQVKLTSGEWLDVPCNFGYLVINTGDMLQEASGGYFPSTTHRVVNPEGIAQNRSRISLPLFLHPRPDVVLSDRYTAKTYLQERLQELGVK